ncbi:MAG: tellurite resistance TerB family protein [Polyangiaceae bacterium]
MTSEGLLSRVVAGIARTGDSGESPSQRSILSQAATSYARKPQGAEQTIPTGFDPQAASLFEAVIEACFLVANADGDFDEKERQTFEQVVHEACQNTVQRSEVSALVSDLLDQLEEDGVAARVHMIGRIVSSEAHALEVLRIAALMAYVSGGVDATERAVMDQLAAAFSLPASAVADAIEQATTALAS